MRVRPPAQTRKRGEDTGPFKRRVSFDNPSSVVCCGTSVSPSRGGGTCTGGIRLVSDGTQETTTIVGTIGLTGPCRWVEVRHQLRDRRTKKEWAS